MKKFIFLLYGIVAYLIFFGTFSYAVGFVSTLLVPKHIDSEPISPLGYAFLVNTGLLSLFAIQHSVMARPAFKKWWTKFVPEPIVYAVSANINSTSFFGVIVFNGSTMVMRVYSFN